MGRGAPKAVGRRAWGVGRRVGRGCVYESVCSFTAEGDGGPDAMPVQNEGGGGRFLPKRASAPSQEARCCIDFYVL